MPKSLRKASFPFILAFVFVIWFIFVHPQISSISIIEKSLQNIQEHKLLTIDDVRVLNLYLLISAISFLPFAFFDYSIYKKIFHKNPKRDTEYLSNSLNPSSQRLPITTLEQLVTHVAGKEYINDQNVINVLQQNITPIEDWLRDRQGETILLVDGKWGNGKTTAVLVAANQCYTPDYRYIYESTFKYNRNSPDFAHDILKTINEILEEFDVETTNHIDAIASNISLDIKQSATTIINNIIGNSKLNLTTDLISKLNNEYSTSGKRFKIIVIIDDIDRLNGEDLLSTLSFISILRRLDFVRVIIPTDTNAVIHHLKQQQIYQPEIFIRKYLTSQESVLIKNGEEMLKQLLSLRLQQLQNNKDIKNASFNGAWNAITIKFVANKIENNAKLHEWGNYAMAQWTDRLTIDAMTGENTAQWEMHNQIDQMTTLLINRARTKLAKELAEHKHYSPSSSIMPELEPDFIWSTKGSTDIRHFEDIITAPVITTHCYEAIAHHFDETYYNILVESWLPDYISTYWNILDVSIRELMDIVNQHANSLETLDQTNMAKQFQQTFNILFPESAQITMESERGLTKAQEADKIMHDILEDSHEEK